MKHRMGIVVVLVVVGLVIVVGLAWMLADPEFTLPSLLRGGVWAVAVFVAGLLWMTVEYRRDRRKALRVQLKRLRQIDWVVETEGTRDTTSAEEDARRSRR